MKVYGETGGNVLSVNEVPQDQVHQYGIVGVGERKGAGFKITGMVEKPKAADAPSNYSISGRYILQPEIFALLEKQQKGAGGEIQLTDSMLTLAKAQDFYGYEFEGRIFDCGSKLGFLTANIAYGLERDDLAPALRAEIKSICG
jgi:UTP--glucose-1-phosphate uridylyltransferase